MKKKVQKRPCQLTPFPPPGISWAEVRRPEGRRSKPVSGSTWGPAPGCRSRLPGDGLSPPSCPGRRSPRRWNARAGGSRRAGNAGRSAAGIPARRSASLRPPKERKNTPGQEEQHAARARGQAAHGQTDRPCNGRDRRSIPRRRRERQKRFPLPPSSQQGRGGIGGGEGWSSSPSSVSASAGMERCLRPPHFSPSVTGRALHSYRFPFHPYRFGSLGQLQGSCYQPV